MFKYCFRIFHTGIIALFLIGCGYKTDPVWEDDSNLTKVEQNVTK